MVTTDINKLENLYIISEEWLLNNSVKASEVLDDEQNEFLKLLADGNEFRKAGLSPIYLMNAENQSMFVSAMEYCSMRLH